MEISLLRRDFMNNPKTLGLSCDYRVLLGCCTVNPVRSAAGVTHWSPVTCKKMGYEPRAAVAGLKNLRDQGFILFSEKTLESLPADYFVQNKLSGAFGKVARKSVERICCEDLKKAWKDLADQGFEVVPTYALPSSLISSLPPRGEMLMASDAAVALALCCNEFLSCVGCGEVDVELLAEMTSQTSAAAAQGLKNVAARGVVDVNEKTGEYIVMRWLKLTGKLRTEEQVQEAVDNVKKIKGKRQRNLARMFHKPSDPAEL